MRNQALGAVALFAFGCASADPETSRAIARDVDGLTTVTARLAASSTIYQDTTDDNGGGYGRVCVGNRSTGASSRRSLIRFDPPIPSTAVVERVVLSIAQEVVPPGSGTSILELHEVEGDWTEGGGTLAGLPEPTDPAAWPQACDGGSASPGVTWSSQPASRTSASASVALSASPTAVNVDSNSPGNAGLVADVRGWVSTPGRNRGWLVRVADESAADTMRLLRVDSATFFFTKGDGTVCTQNGDCASQSCLHPDGTACAGRAGCVCCDAACSGACETCHRAGMVGTCSPKPASTVCRAGSCAGGVALTEATCDGFARDCPAPESANCSPYSCGPNGCLTTCATDEDCEAPHVCNERKECEPAEDTCDHRWGRRHGHDRH
jgi:hypothetical protein